MPAHVILWGVAGNGFSHTPVSMYITLQGDSYRAFVVLLILARNGTGKMSIMLHGVDIIMILCIGKEVIKILRLQYYVMLHALARAAAQYPACAPRNVTCTAKGGSENPPPATPRSATCTSKSGSANICPATHGAGKMQPLEQIDDLLG